MTNGDYCVPGNAVPTVKMNAVPRRSRWKQSLTQIFVNNLRNWWSMDPCLTWNFSDC